MPCRESVFASGQIGHSHEQAQTQTRRRTLVDSHCAELQSSAAAAAAATATSPGYHSQTEGGTSEFRLRSVRAIARLPRRVDATRSVSGPFSEDASKATRESYHSCRAAENWTFLPFLTIFQLCRSHLDTTAPPQHAAHYFTGSAPPPQPYTSERHFCLVCRTDFTDKAEFMFHVRTHFGVTQAAAAAAPQQGGANGKQANDQAAADLIARGLVDPTGLCS